MIDIHKHRLRSFLDYVAAYTGLLQWQEWKMRRGLTILMYHRVLPWDHCVSYPLPALVMPVEVFRRQMQWLAQHCRVLPVGEAMAELAMNAPVARPLVSVTFDDGYDDSFSMAAPILNQYQLRGTFFVTTGFVAVGQPQWYDRAVVAWQAAGEQSRHHLLQKLRRARNDIGAEKEHDGAIRTWLEGLKLTPSEKRMELVLLAESLLARSPDFSRYQPMSPEQVRQLHQQGHEIASHTVSHAILPLLPATAIAAELQNSREKLANWIGEAPTGFCYPNGNYDARVEKEVLKAGYDYACTVEEGINLPGVPPTRLARLPITRQRTMRGQDHDALGFRAELCRLRSHWRKIRRP